MVLWAGLAATTSGRTASPSQSPTPVWDGVYTEEQAKRGQETYTTSCGGCHRDNLSGGDEGQPPLTGVFFIAHWNGTTLGDLFAKIARDMPESSPGSLSPRAYADVLAFLLKSNRMPAGQTELPPNPERLNSILLTESPSRR